MSEDTLSPEERVRRALARPRSWAAVEQAFSVIEKDLQGSGELGSSRLAMANQIARFQWSVALQVGACAAVAASRFEAPVAKRPMTLAEAYAFVSRLAMAWAALRKRAASTA